MEKKVLNVNTNLQKVNAGLIAAEYKIQGILVINWIYFMFVLQATMVTAWKDSRNSNKFIFLDCVKFKFKYYMLTA